MAFVVPSSASFDVCGAYLSPGPSCWLLPTLAARYVALTAPGIEPVGCLHGSEEVGPGDLHECCLARCRQARTKYPQVISPRQRSRSEVQETGGPTWPGKLPGDSPVPRKLIAARTTNVIGPSECRTLEDPSCYIRRSPNLSSRSRSGTSPQLPPPRSGRSPESRPARRNWREPHGGTLRNVTTVARSSRPGCEDSGTGLPHMSITGSPPSARPVMADTRAARVPET